METLKPVEASESLDMGRYIVPYLERGTPNDKPSVVLLPGISMAETHLGELPEELAALGHHVVVLGLPRQKYPPAVANAMRHAEYAAEATRDFMSGNPFAWLELTKRMSRHHSFMPTLESYAYDQRPAIRELTGHRPYDMLGLSFGGLLAQQHELDDRENMNSLVLAATFPAAAVPLVDMPDVKAIAGVCSHDRSPQKIADIYGGDFSKNPEVLEKFREIVDRKIDPVDHANQLFAVSYSIGMLIARRMLHRVSPGEAAETLVMAGTEDKIMPYNTVKLAAKALGLELETIHSDGHGFLLSRAPEMARIISNFLRTEEAPIQLRRAELSYPIAA